MTRSLQAWAQPVLASCGLFGQTPPPPPALECASVKPAAPGDGRGSAAVREPATPAIPLSSRYDERANRRAYEWAIPAPWPKLPKQLYRRRVGTALSPRSRRAPRRTIQQISRDCWWSASVWFSIMRMKNMAYYELVVAKSGLKMKEGGSCSRCRSGRRRLRSFRRRRPH